MLSCQTEFKVAAINPATVYAQYFGVAPANAFYNSAAATGPGPEAVQRDVTTNVPAHPVHGNIPAKTIHGTAAAGSTNMDARLTWLHHRTEQQQFELDVAMWYGLMHSATANAAKVSMVQRIFQVLHWGGLFFKRGGVWSPWHGTGMPLAAALSHGGRVIVQLPPGLKANQFWLWLWNGGAVGGGGLTPGANQRSAATHGATYRANPQRIGTKLCFYDEDKLSAVNPRAHSSKHFGVNIGVGGDGHTNPFSGLQIDDSGSHGHLYIYYRNEVAENSLCMLSCEDSAPMDRYQGTWQGIWNGQYAVGQTGHAHKFGGAGAFTATGGKTWDQAGWTATGPDTKYNCMFIDLSDPLLVDMMLANTDYDDLYLGDDGIMQLGNYRTIPTVPQWLALSKQTFSSRDAALLTIDARLATYWTTRNSTNLLNLRNACTAYQSTNANRMAAVQLLLGQL